MENKKIVAIGGGTGLSIILHGLKNITHNITAIVTVADDGGGSGVLREDLGMLPPGDIRSCLLALSNTEPLLEDLFNYRFENGKLSGQSFGNLMIAAMRGISKDFNDAILKVGKIIAINGQVLPVTLEDVHLIAELENGLKIKGESRIPFEAVKNKSPIKYIKLIPEKPKPTDGVLDAIKEADVVVIGPGSLYTSIIPNLLVDGVVKSIKESKCKTVYIANIMTQSGETNWFSLKDHLTAIEEHVGMNIFDAVLVNKESLSKEIKQKYKLEDSFQIKMGYKDKEYLKENNIELILENYLEVVKHYCRHDANKLAEDINKYIL